MLFKLEELLKFTTLIEPTYTTQDVSEQHTYTFCKKTPSDKRYFKNYRSVLKHIAVEI